MREKLTASEIEQIALNLVRADDVLHGYQAGRIALREAESEALDWLMLVMTTGCSMPDEVLARVAGHLAILSAARKADPYFEAIVSRFVSQLRMVEPASLPKATAAFATIGPVAEKTLAAEIRHKFRDRDDRLVSAMIQIRGGAARAIEAAMARASSPKLSMEERARELALVGKLVERDPKLLDDQAFRAIRDFAVPVSQFEDFHTTALNTLKQSGRLESAEIDRFTLMHTANYGMLSDSLDAVSKLGKSAGEFGVAKTLIAVLQYTRRPELVLACADSLANTGEQIGPGADVLVRAMVDFSQKEPLADRVQQRQNDTIVQRLAKVVAACGEEGARAVDKSWRESKDDRTSCVLPHIASVGSAAAPMLSAMYDASRLPADQLAITTELARATMYCPVAERKLLAIATKSDANVPERLTAISAFRWSDGRDPAIHQALQAALTSDNADLRSAAAETIIRLPPPDAKLAIDAVLPWLAGDAAQHRVEAAMLLRELPGKVPAEKVLPELLKMTTNQKPQTRIAAAYAIAAIDPKGETASHAARNLAAHADVIALRLLMPGLQARKDNALRGDMRVMSLQDPNAEVREAARWVVQTIGLPE